MGQRINIDNIIDNITTTVLTHLYLFPPQYQLLLTTKLNQCYDYIVILCSVTMPKIGISISERSLEYLDSHTDNRSAFIEELVEAQRKKDFQKELEDDYAELEKDPEFQAEVKAWDCAAGDGIDDDE